MEFHKYILVKGNVAFHILEYFSFEEAQSFGVGVTTIVLGFYKYLSLPLLTFPLPMPSSEPKLPILIYGGSSATGTLAVQFAKLSGMQHDPNCGAEIRPLTQNKPHHVFDTIFTQSTAQTSTNALSTFGDNLYINLMGIEMPRDDVRNTFFLKYSATGEEYEIEREVWPAAPEDFELGKDC
ncbi:hypothetical protein ACHAQE_009065 [Botrytis cinerea]